MKMKRGIQEERQLARLFWKRGFAVMRAPASGASTQMPRPDIVTGNSEKGVQFAIEVKTTNSDKLYIAHESIRQLLDFSQLFGCKPILALKFKGKSRSWLFIMPKYLALTPSLNYKITFIEALRIGMDFKTLIKEGKQAEIPFLKEKK